MALEEQAVAPAMRPSQPLSEDAEAREPIPLTTHVIDHLAAAREFVPEWLDLFRRAGCRHPFMSPEWLFTWLEEWRDVRTPLLIAVRDRQRRLVALAPLSIERVRLAGVPVRRLAFIGDRGVGSDYLGLLVDPDCGPAPIEPIAAAIEAHRASWDFIELCDVDPDDRPIDQLQQRLRRNAGAASTQVASTCPYAPLPATFDAYFASLGSNLRSKLRRLGRRLEERGAVQWCEYTDGAGLAGAYDELVALHRLRFTDRQESSAFLEPRAQSFHRVALARLAERGWVRLFVLRLDGRPLAALMGYATRDKFMFYQAGMDPSWSEMRPGQLLMSRTIDRAIQMGHVEYDFLRGSEEYKRMWASHTRETLTHTLYGRGWRARLAQSADALRRRLGALKRKLVARGRQPKEGGAS